MMPKEETKANPVGTDAYLCETCGMYVTYTHGADLYKTVIEHHAVCKPSPLAATHKRINEVVPPQALKGNLVSLEDILDRDVLVTDVNWGDSTYKEDTVYLSLTIMVNGEEKVLNTGAARIVQAFKSLKLEDLPVIVAFEKIQMPNGRRVYRVKE